MLDTAHRTQQTIGAVIRYAVATGRAETDPTVALRGALPAYKSGHMAAPARKVFIAAGTGLAPFQPMFR